MEEKERYKLESYNEAFCQIHDTESDEWYLRKDLVKDLLNQQDQKIKNLEHRLSNCIELPKYKKGQKIYYIRGGKIEEAYFQRFNNWITADVILNPHEVTDDDGYTDVDYDFDMISPEQMFKTREDAEKKLKDIKKWDFLS